MEYTPSTRFENANVLQNNHYRFSVEALPDLSQYVQAVTIPSIGIPVVPYNTPFVKLPQVGDHIEFGIMDVTFTLDAKFKTYFSLFAWLRGYGFPTTYEELESFKQARIKQLANVRPVKRDIERTNATLSILHPDTDKAVVDFVFTGLFPTALGTLELKPTDSNSPPLTNLATFHYENFEVVPYSL